MDFTILKTFQISTDNLNNLKKNIHVFKKVNVFQVPPDTDTLFWCFYYMSRDESNDLFEQHNAAKERQEKIEWVEKLRQHKVLLKEKKLAPLTHIENQLANERKIDLPTFLSLCLCQSINVCVIRRKTIVQCLSLDSTTKPLFLVKDLGYNKFGFMKEDICKLNEIVEQYYCIEKIDKPIKSVSSYTIKELSDICKKLDISLDEKKKKTKADLYEEIVKALPL